MIYPKYLQAYLDEYRRGNQGPTGCCTGYSESSNEMWCALNVHNVKIPQLSAGFAYFAGTNDATFSKGNSPIMAANACQVYGVCTDALFPEASLLANWQGGGAYPASGLPSPAAWTDAATRKVTQWAYLSGYNPNMDQVDALLENGYAVSYSLGNHRMLLGGHDSDHWIYYALDSEMYNNDFGYGLGIRGVSRNVLQTNARDFITVQSVQVVVPPIVPIPPPTGPNLLLASAGGVATASSQYSAGYPITAINNGDRKGLSWGAGGGWNDGTLSTWPDWAQITIPVAKSIGRVVVYTLQDNYAAPIEPTDTLTFSTYGIKDFEVQGLEGANWVSLATVAGNSLVKRTMIFTPRTVSAIRILVSGSKDGRYSRIIELEAYAG